MGAAPATLPAKVYFDTGKAQLGPDSAAVIESVAVLLAADPTAKVDITGFTDMTGDASANVELGKRRAMAVRAALASAGVASDRVSMKTPMSVEGGAGDADAEARRVEITAGK
jgi:cytochrome c oxidase subunit 2